MEKRTGRLRGCFLQWFLLSLPIMMSPSALIFGVTNLSCILHPEPSPQSGLLPGLLFALSPFFGFRWIVGNLRSELGRKKKGIGEMKIREEIRGKETVRHQREKNQRDSDTYTRVGTLIWRQKNGFASQLIYFKLCEVGKVTWLLWASVFSSENGNNCTSSAPLWWGLYRMHGGGPFVSDKALLKMHDTWCQPDLEREDVVLAHAEPGVGHRYS